MLLRNSVFPHEYMDDWEKFDETEREDFYSHLKMVDITSGDYTHANEVCKEFDINNLGEDGDLCLQSDTLLLANIFINFRKMCLEIYRLHSAHFASNPN